MAAVRRNRLISNHPAWRIAIYAGASPLTLRPSLQAPGPAVTWECITDVNAAFVADPFAVRTGKMWWLFFEVFNLDKDRGEIGLSVSEDGFAWRYHGIVLREPFHLSYPCVFEFENRYYLVPETARAHSIQLYSTDHFPLGWRLIKPLIAGDFVDPTIFRGPNCWWMFACKAGWNNQLHLFQAQDLLGPWMEHPRSPVLDHDACRARPAGKLIPWRGRLLRPAQDCATYYGRYVRACEIATLTQDNYCEHEIVESPILAPAWAGYKNGMHHVDAHCLEDESWIGFVDGH